MPTAKKASKSSYDVHPSLAMYQSSLAALKQQTGRTLEEWIGFVEKEGPATEKERREWLKDKHGLGRNYAWWVAEQSVGKGADGTPETYLKQADEYVEKTMEYKKIKAEKEANKSGGGIVLDENKK